MPDYVNFDELVSYTNEKVANAQVFTYQALSAPWQARFLSYSESLEDEFRSLAPILLQCMYCYSRNMVQ
jgi:hypothetical protein